jgi:hypothetical protein
MTKRLSDFASNAPMALCRSRIALIVAACTLFMASPSALHADEGVVYRPLQFGGVHEFGAIYDGLYAPKTGPEVSPMEWTDHFGVYLRQDVVVDRHLELQLGLGGVFQFAKPEYVYPKFFSSMYKMFFFGPAIAKATYSFGDPESKNGFRLGGGLFPFKYNPDAANLGEYLFRAAPYPSYITTGGLLFVGDNAAYLQGLHASWRRGGFSVDGLFVTETFMPPLYDWSLALLTSYSVADGLVELGAGVNFKRIVQIDPDRTVRKRDGLGNPMWSNLHFTRNGTTYYGDPVYYQQQADFYQQRADAFFGRGTAADSARGNEAATRAAGLQATADSVTAWQDPTHPGHVTEGERDYYTPAGTVFMARAALDLRKALGMNPGRAPFKVFAEAALLGWENQPVFYEERLRRAPIMAGVHLPTGGLLDQFTFQVEYFGSPWANSTRSLGEQNAAVPWYPEGAEPLFSQTEYNDVTEKDNIAWSLLIRREILPRVNVSAQFARDHLRTVGTNWFYGGRLEPNAILYRNSSWYWMAQIAWGI